MTDPLRPDRPLSGALALSLLGIMLCAGVVPAQFEEVVETYLDGAVRARYSIDAKGHKVGQYVRYYRDGTIRLRATYRENIRNGRYETYYRSGKKRLATAYRNGKLHGKHQEFSKDGRRTLTAHYQDDVLHGSFDVVLDGKSLTRQVWKQGALFQLNGHQPFPRSLASIQSQLKTILKAPAEVPGVDKDPKLPLRLAALRRLQAYRYLCMLAWADMTLDPTMNVLCEAAAQVCEKIGRLDHHPPKPAGMDDDTYNKGYRGASHSNLSMGSGMVRSVDSYMNDSDPSNIARVGHRRWCLNPGMRKTGFGSSGRFSAMWSHDSSGGGAGGIAAIYYPPRGYTPVDFFGPRHAFSISIIKGGQAKKDSLDIKITPLDKQYLPAGAPLELDYLNVTTGGAGVPHVLIFRPVGLVVEPGRRYWVAVSYDKGKTLAHEYLVEFVDVVKVDD
ncbi:MAG: CAP domain-containing protein [Planctomycetota bacterium]